jgi:hypothetical protein
MNRTVYAESWRQPVAVLFLKSRRELRLKYDAAGRYGINNRPLEVWLELGQ